MTLPAGNPISVSDILTELKLSAPLSLNAQIARLLCNKPADPLSLSDFFGRSYSKHAMGTELVGSTSGYFRGQAGTLTPDTLRALFIRHLVTNGSQFIISIFANPPRDFFRAVFFDGLEFKTGPGLGGSYFSGLIDSATGGTYSEWRWNHANTVFSGAPVPVEFFY
jgi:hypothetical protein